MTDLSLTMMKIADQLAGTYINVDGFAGNQCWDSAARVSQLMGLPVINTGGKGRWPGWAGNMWDAFPQSKEIDAAYYRVTPDQPALPGDKAIWGDSYWYYPATHVADVIADAGGLLLCLSQNSSAAEPSLPNYSTESSGPAIIQHLPKQGLLGYIRPRAGVVLQGEIITDQEEDDMYTEADRTRDTLAAARVDYLWEHYGPAQSGYKTEGSMERVLLDTKTAAQATLTSVTPGVSGGRTAGATVQAMVAIAANQQGKTVGEIVDGVTEKLSDGVEFVLQTKQEG